MKREAIKVAVVTSSRWKSAGQDVAHAIGLWLQRANIEVRMDVEGTANLAELGKGATVCFSVGGDGTMLSTARRMHDCPIPTVGVNFGKLGFLAEFTEDEIRDWIAGRIELDLRIIPRMMLQCTMKRAIATSGSPAVETRFGLNDAVLHQGVMTRLATVDMWVDDEHATQYRCDGLVVSSPVGSTAYSLSLGGPILTPGMRAFIVTPIAPHALTNRPIIVEGARTLRFRLATRVDEAALVIDGQETLPLVQGDEFEVRAAETDFPLVSHARRSYYELLKNKLEWGSAPVLKDE